MSNSQRTDPIRIVFFGTPGAFSRRLLLSLERPDILVVGVVHRAPLMGNAAVRRIEPRPNRALPLYARGGNVLEHAPRYLVRDLASPETTAMLFDARPDLMVVACFPARIPGALRRIPTLGAINVHPSLLPRHRGPDPIFWAFRHGERETGVSLHLMDDGFDTGPVLAQTTLRLQDGATVTSVDAALADQGARLLGQLLDRLPEIGQPAVQDEAQATYESHPTPADLTIDTSWSVDRARWFITGVGKSHGPLFGYDSRGGIVRFRSLATRDGGTALRLSDGAIHVASERVSVSPPSALL